MFDDTGYTDNDEFLEEFPTTWTRGGNLRVRDLV